MKETSWTRIREQNSVDKEFLEIVDNGSPTGSVLKETIAVSDTISIGVQESTQPNPSPNSLPEVPEERVPVAECLDGPARMTSEELAPFHWHPPECLFYKTKSGCKFGEKYSYAHRQVDEQPNKRSKTNDDKSAVALSKKKNDLHESTWELVLNRDECHDRPGWPDVNRDTCHELKRGPVGCRSSNTRQLGCVFQDMKPPKFFLRKSWNIRKLIRRVKFTTAFARHADLRDQNPSLGMICPGEPHQRS